MGDSGAVDNSRRAFSIRVVAIKNTDEISNDGILQQPTATYFCTRSG